MQHDAPGLLELGDDGAWAVARGLDDADALVDDGLSVGAVVWRVDGGQEGDVDGEGVLGQGAALLDLLAEVLGRGEDEGGDDAQAAGVGDGGGEFGVADVLDGRHVRYSGRVKAQSAGDEKRRGSGGQPVDADTYHHASLHDRDCEYMSARSVYLEVYEVH